MLRRTCALLLALALGGLPPWAAHATNTHGLPDATQEMRAYWGDYTGSYVASGCLPTVPSSSLTFGAFACTGYVLDSGQLVYVAQAAAALGPLAAGNGTYYLALHRDTSTTVANWTRRAGTHYLWRQVAAQPATVAGLMVFASVTVAGGVITAVTDLRPQGVLEIDRFLSEANPLQSALNALKPLSQGGTIRVPAGLTVPVPTAVTTPAGMSRIRIVCDGLSSGFQWSGGNSDTLLTFSTGANRSSLEGCQWTLSAAQTGITYLVFAAGATQEITLRDNLFNGADYHIQAAGELLNFRSENNWYFDAAVRAFNGLNTGGSMIGLSFRSDHFQGTAATHVYLQGGSGFHFQDVIIDGSRSGASTGIEVASFDTFSFIGGQIEFQGSHASIGINLGTTALGTGNASGAVIQGSRIDAAALGVGINLGYTRAVLIQSNEFQRAGYGIQVSANSRNWDIGPNTFAANVTQPYNLAGALYTGTVRDSVTGYILPPHAIQATSAEITNGGALMTTVADTANAITQWTIHKINTDTGAGAITHMPLWGFNAAAGTHPSLAAVGAAGKSGHIKTEVDGALAYIPLQAQASVFQLVPQASAPATCAIGDVYVDTSGAFCTCTATDTWTNTTGVGACT